MSLATVYCRAPLGVKAPLVNVEVHLANGLPAFNIVGLPETEVKESKDRVRAAIQNARFEFPARRITINLAPADLPKEGGRFDLPIAIGILAASEQIPSTDLHKYEFIAEMGLGGELRAVKGILPSAIQTREAGRTLVACEENAREASLVKDLAIHPAKHLLEVCAHLCGEQLLTFQAVLEEHNQIPVDDLSDVKAQHHAKRALEIAAAGKHSLLMIGPPGTGKTMLAKRLPGILPAMTEQEALETAALHSVSNHGFDPQYWQTRPFRAPHHTASGVALVGGGSNPRPGEISLAHNGVMFLDELPEFDRKVLEVLREPLESGSITISRAARQAEFPSRFQLIAAMNPCPCGYHGHSNERCRCTPDQIQRYRNRISGPLMDRIDMHIEVPNVSLNIIQDDSQEESSHSVKHRIEQAHQRQLDRSNRVNSQLSSQQLNRYCQLNDHDRNLLEQAINKLGLSARAYHRILKVARTIADLSGSDDIKTTHLTEAISYRKLDRPVINA